MATLLINYADQAFYEAQKRNAQSGLGIGGFDRVIPYGRKDLDAGFLARNHKTLREPAGAGYWLWKPYVVVKALKQELAKGDVLFYADSGCHFVKPAAPIIELCLKQTPPILLFTLHPTFTNRRFTTSDCFHFMGMDKPSYPGLVQITASFFLCRKTEATVAFFEEWLAYAEDPRLLDPLGKACGLPNYPEFFEHRFDQSILSLLGRKHAIATVPDISQWGNPDRPPGIPQIIEHTRWKA